MNEVDGPAVSGPNSKEIKATGKYILLRFQGLILHLSPYCVAYKRLTTFQETFVHKKLISFLQGNGKLNYCAYETSNKGKRQN